MKFRCSPYNPLMFIVFLGAFIFCHNHMASAQCTGDFSFQSFDSEKHSASGKSASGKIEVSVKNPTAGTYTFKVYSVSGEITLVQTQQAYTPDKVIFERLDAATYYVKVEWGEGCYKTVGGIEGISITEKDQE